MSRSLNLLPFDGDVYYFGSIFNEESSDHYMKKLLTTIDWKNDEAIIFGKKIITKRKVAWYGSKPFNYTYSKVTKKAMLWTDELLEIKKQIEVVTGVSFNSCLLNLYHDGSEGMAWHCDGERELEKHGVIASVSFGAKRRFCFKHKVTKDKIELELDHGSLLTMERNTQDHWLHRLPPTTKVTKPRINLTFRTINE